MFPSKLYDLQLTPSLRKFNSDLESEKVMSKFSALLREDKKELFTSALDLMKAVSIAMYGTQAYHCQLNELCTTDLSELSRTLQRKIIVYDVSTTELRCQVITNGYHRKIYLARYLNYFYVVAPLGSTDKHHLAKDIIQDMVNSVVGAPQRRHKRSFSDPFKYLSDQKDSRKVNIKNVPVSPSNISRVSWQDSAKIQMREQFIDEINQEGDQLMKECNSILNSPSPQNNDILYSLSLNMPEQAITGVNDGQLSGVKTSQIRYYGTLKFYDESRSYGFIIMDLDGSDLFVHCDDLTKAGMSKEYLRTAKHGNMIRFSFQILEYFGKYNKSRKAVELQYQQSSPYYM